MMNLANAPAPQLRLSLVPHTTPIVFVVDNDVSMRESLDAMILSGGWHPQVFASAQEFLALPRVFVAELLGA
jgi:FixJ family two-component response regulator